MEIWKMLKWKKEKGKWGKDTLMGERNNRGMERGYCVLGKETLNGERHRENLEKEKRNREKEKRGKREREIVKGIG